MDRATRLVEQLLALARHDGRGAAAAATPVDLVALARRAVHDAAPEAQVRQIELRGPQELVPVEVQGQADALAVLLRNLIDNALRHTPTGGVVQVSARRDENGAIELVVEDSGPGIPPSERQRVLDRFYRVPGAAGHGSGLGLAIVQAVARRHGAGVEVGESAGLGGARVSVVWPID
ncbi:MAG: ATP-binding protein [Burkholderiaceae bacterium]